MINEGALDGVDEIYGLHNMPIFDKGLIVCRAGAVMAGSSRIVVKVTGIDAIEASSSFHCQS